jgi:putative cardiolipin synthase
MSFLRSLTMSGALVLLISGCVIAPFDYPREPSTVIAASADTSLGRTVQQWAETHPNMSGFYPLEQGRDALGARLRLIELAEKSIDVQYFLMKGDTAGQVFAGSLLRAADRGVRVRFLLDDVFSTIEDEELELLSVHPNIEMRLYNPIARKGVGIVNFFADFRRANRRMHNKSFTVDNQVTIVGGRNIADEYFDLRPEGEFMDLDVLALGPIAGEVSKVFDRFWNNRRSVPMEAFASRFTADDLARARQAIDERIQAAGQSAYSDAVNSELVRDLFADWQPLYLAMAEVLTDEPDKLTSAVSADNAILVRKLQEAVADAKEEVIVYTPYFVPGIEGVRFWKSIVDKGVSVTLITNSLASNNHTSVHAGYAKFRKRIIEAGVKLYEIRANAANGGAEALILHRKGMIMDRHRVFVGSLNLDPRSIWINSEMGLLISNADMGEALAKAAFEQLPDIAYRVTLDERRRLRWTATIDGVEVVEKSEPLASKYHRFEAFLMRIIPDNQL